jgi:hypothetical protein
MGFTFRDIHWSSVEECEKHDPHFRAYLDNQRAAARESREQEAAAQRMALADKIVMAVVDQICAAIIRPGPKPEERECYVMAQELREFAPDLREIVAAALKIEAEEAPQVGEQR